MNTETTEMTVMPPEQQAIITPEPSALIVPRDGQLEVTATTPDEMLHANEALIGWCYQKIATLEAESKELMAAHEHAKSRKWATGTLKKHANMALKRVEFFGKMRSALVEGYYIVPNFPVSMFAIRTDRKKPLRMWMQDNRNWGLSTHTQLASSLPQGEGVYRNPDPEVEVRGNPSEKFPQATVHWAEDWKSEIEFPLTMAKPQIMEATSRAMALNIFDEFGILTEDAKVTRKRQDPLIVGRILDPRSTAYDRKVLTFVIAWFLDTKVI
jgi:hypothetical protein